VVIKNYYRQFLLKYFQHIFSDIVRCLHNVSIQFIPPAVERGQNVMLYCNYDLDGAPMLSVKWYRGSHEFYRYSPGMIPTTQTFPFHGLNVDVSKNYSQNLISKTQYRCIYFDYKFRRNEMI